MTERARSRAPLAILALGALGLVGVALRGPSTGGSSAVSNPTTARSVADAADGAAACCTPPPRFGKSDGDVRHGVGTAGPLSADAAAHRTTLETALNALLASP